MNKFIVLLLIAGAIMSTGVTALAEVTHGANGGTRVHAYDPASISPYNVGTLSRFIDVDNGDGRWDQGTRLTWNGRKKVWSNLDHNTKVHRSSCEIDGNKDDSGWVPARTTSRSSVVGHRNSVGYTNWDVK